MVFFILLSTRFAHFMAPNAAFLSSTAKGVVVVVIVVVVTDLPFVQCSPGCFNKRSQSPSAGSLCVCVYVCVYACACVWGWMC